MKREGKQSQNILAVRELTAWYESGKPVLKNLSIDLQDHEIVGLIGLNGAGKTTLLHILSGIHEGYCLEGKKRGSFREQGFKRRRYTVFAEDNGFAYLTFREYLDYVSAAYGKDLAGTEELVKGFHFTAYTDTLLGELSLGNRRKACLIAAFALKPELLLLDEPVNGLDFESTEYLYRQIAGYRTYGTVFFASHVLESITQTCDRVLVLERGQITRSFSGEEIDAEKIRKILEPGGRK